MIRRPLHQKRSLPFRACIVDLGCITRATTWDGKRTKTPATTLSLCLDPQDQAYLKKTRRLADCSSQLAFHDPRIGVSAITFRPVRQMSTPGCGKLYAPIYRWSSVPTLMSPTGSIGLHCELSHSSRPIDVGSSLYWACKLRISPQSQW